jgi:hypothetical protein
MEENWKKKTIGPNYTLENKVLGWGQFGKVYLGEMR